MSIINFHNVDCMDFMQSIPDKHYDLAIVDIEYGIGASKPSNKPCKVVQKNGTVLQAPKVNYTKKDWDFKMSNFEYFEELFRISKNQIIWGGFYYGLSGGAIVWDKLNGDADQFDCEIAWQSFNKRTDLFYFLWSGMMQGIYCGRDVRKALKQQGNKKLNEHRIHPTQKPVALYKWLLTNYAKAGDKILDTHGGSGSIAIACHDLDFDLDICELDKEYFDDSKKRYNNHISQLTLF